MSILAKERTLITFGHAPYGDYRGRSGLDLCLMLLAFDADVSLYFYSDGVFNLLNEQEPNQLKIKGMTKGFASLSSYGMSSLFVSQACMEQRGLDASDLMVEPRLLCTTHIADFFAEYHVHFSY